MVGALLDTLYGLLPRSRCFADGWGDLRALDFDLAGRLEGSPAALVPTFEPARSHDGIVTRDGSLASPSTDLPPEARMAHLRWLLPAHGTPRSVAVAFAAWGDEGFELRTRLLAPLVRGGLSALLLELPYYGARRPAGQRGPLLRTVSDFVRLGEAALAEARGLVAWLRAEGYEPGAMGFSMGGQLACLVAASCPFPVTIVAIAPSSSPAPVFTEGPIARGVAWSALRRDGRGPARPRLRELMERISVLALPPPADPRRAMLVGTRHDRIVPPREVERIAAHWRDARLRWLDAGHVSAVTLHTGALRRAIGDGFGIALS